MKKHVRRAPHNTVDSENRSAYKVWRGMIRRCCDPKASGYSSYGGKGIAVCSRWLFFPNFLADMGCRAEGMTIDRIDGTKGYDPANCRWVSMVENLQNKSPRPERDQAISLSDLSSRQQEVAICVRDDMSAREIAFKLGITLETVRSYVKTVQERTAKTSIVGVALWVDRQVR